jgi:phage-related baseplate assembly protein
MLKHTSKQTLWHFTCEEISGADFTPMFEASRLTDSCAGIIAYKLLSQLQEFPLPNQAIALVLGHPIEEKFRAWQ